MIKERLKFKMYSLDYIKEKIESLYKTSPNVHISVNLSKPRLCLDCAPAVIVGVYAHIFRVEENSARTPRQHSLRYAEVAAGIVKLEEL